MVREDREVGVFGASPIYVTGLTSLLRDTGYTFEMVTDPVTWVGSTGGRMLIIGLRSTQDLEVIVDVRQSNPDTVVVTLVDELTLEGIARAVWAGATTTICRDAPAGEVVIALDAAARHGTVIPTDVVRALMARQSGRDGLKLDEMEVDWLRLLAGDVRVSDLAERVGYSEREMYRRLKRLYLKMGVQGRTEALVKASRFGLIG